MLTGLLLVGIAVLVPAWREVERLQQRVATLEQRVEHAQQRQRTGREVLESLRAEDPVTYQRLVAWQWNLVPLGDEPIIRERHDTGIVGWVEAKTPPPDPVPVTAPKSRLEKLTSPEARPWLLGAGGLCLLVGIVALPMPDRSRTDDV